MQIIKIAILATALFWQTAIHEIAHIIIPKLRGMRVKVKPYPHFENGRFYFGTSMWWGILPTKLLGLTILMPRIIDIIEIIIFSIVGLFNPTCMFWVALQMIAAIDFTYNTCGVFVNRLNDANETMDLLVPSWSSLKRKVVSIVALVVLWSYIVLMFCLRSPTW